MSHKFSNSFLVCVFAHSKVLIMQTAFQITDNDRKQASTSIDCSHWCRWHCGDPRRRHRTPSKRWKAKRVSRADRESERSRWLLSWSNKGEGFSGRRHRLGTLHSLSASASAGTAVRRCLEAAPTACRLLLPPQYKQGEWIDDWKTSDPRRRERERLHNMAAWRRGGRRVNVRSLGKVSVLRGLSAGRQAGRHCSHIGVHIGALLLGRSSFSVVYPTQAEKKRQPLKEGYPRSATLSLSPIQFCQLYVCALVPYTNSLYQPLLSTSSSVTVCVCSSDALSSHDIEFDSVFAQCAVANT